MKMANLIPHPLTPCSWIADARVCLQRTPLGLSFAYSLTGDMAKLKRPAVSSGIHAGSRKDELWRTTCFEAFVRPAGGPAYVELNFAPNGDWAAYSFTGRREGMTDLDMAPPDLTIEDGPGSLRVDVHVQGLAGLEAATDWRVSLSAVLEDLHGARSYWAIAHAAPQPDFHHPDSFALIVPLQETP